MGDVFFLLRLRLEEPFSTGNGSAKCMKKREPLDGKGEQSAGSVYLDEKKGNNG